MLNHDNSDDGLLGRIEKWIVVVAIAFASILIFIAVVLRYGFSYSASAFDELTRYAAVLAVFVAASRQLQHGRHIAVDVLLVYLPPRLRDTLQLAANLAGAAFCAALAYFGVVLVSQSMTLGTLSMSNLRIPLWIPQSAVPIGAALMFIRFVHLALSKAAVMKRGPNANAR